MFPCPTSRLKAPVVAPTLSTMAVMAGVVGAVVSTTMSLWSAMLLVPGMVKVSDIGVPARFLGRVAEMAE